VSENSREAKPESVLHDVKVAVAQAAGPHSHQHFLVEWLINVDINDFEVLPDFVHCGNTDRGYTLKLSGEFAQHLAPTTLSVVPGAVPIEATDQSAGVAHPADQSAQEGYPGHFA
jgi:hypothetical protein